MHRVFHLKQGHRNKPQLPALQEGVGEPRSVMPTQISRHD